jgi:hypothetical protein
MNEKQLGSILFTKMRLLILMNQFNFYLYKKNQKIKKKIKKEKKGLSMLYSNNKNISRQKYDENELTFI